MWLAFLFIPIVADEPAKPFDEGKRAMEGFFDLFWDEGEAKLYLAIEAFDEPFLFVNSLVTGLGSNDIGLDRGQLGRDRLVHFRRVGNRVYLVQPNLRYRANSNDPQERKAVAESFAYTTLWGGDIAAEENGKVYVDVGSLALRDEHGIVRRLKSADEGSYRLDPARSHYNPKAIKSFPDNTEIEVALTFEGEPSGPFLRTVTPTNTAFTLHQRYSFVRLPDDGFKPRKFHPKSGAFYVQYRDYAVPLDEDLDIMLVPRHRLVRKNPGAERSELVEPLVYYVDSGAPPQIKQALIEGASWWNRAFEAAGIVNGFRVEELPAGADPMDVRYNVIQWVHRSTRGWSYGGSVIDPRTGEIIKGHVTLGSLRVRQDRLIFEGLVPVSGSRNEGEPDPVTLALARIRQLSAHEVGHTLGIAHNFAASNFGRASVMDYPAPLIRLDEGKPDLSQVYDRGIGEWDKLVIRYLYGEFENEEEGLAGVLREAEEKNLPFLADQDGRHPRTMHPLGSVWDNGSGDPTAELERVLGVRRYILDHFGPHNLRADKPISQLEEVLVPAYFHHRFQLDACVKSIGGAYFDYGANDGRSHYRPVPAEEQRRALKAVLTTLEPDFLDLPQQLRDLIPPRAYGHEESRESLERRTDPAFDELSLMESSVQMTLSSLLQPERLNRLYNQRINHPELMGAGDLVDALLVGILHPHSADARTQALHRLVSYQVVNALIGLVGNTRLREDVRADLLAALQDLRRDLDRAEPPPPYLAHYQWLKQRLSRIQEDKTLFNPSDGLKIPPGSPIGEPPLP